MIIRRYLNQQVIITTLSVAGVLLAIFLSGRIISYLGLAASGKLDMSFIFQIIGYRLPGFIDLILPLSLFIAILLAFGRMYIDNEMSILFASGISRGQVLKSLWPAMLLVMVVVMATSLYFTPAGRTKSEKIFAQQQDQNIFDLVRPGRFQSLGGRTLYVGQLSADRQSLIDVRLFEQQQSKEGLQQVVIFANFGRTEKVASGERYLVLEQGYQYEVVPGSAAYRALTFQSYRVRLPDPAGLEKVGKLSALDSMSLYALAKTDVKAKAEWLWRISLPLFAPIGMLLAFAMSKVNPRQGRFLKLFPAILVYLMYIVAVGAAKNAVSKESVGSWAVVFAHTLFILIAMLMLNWDSWLRHRAQRKQIQGA